MQQGTGLQFSYVIPDPHLTKYVKCTSFQVKSDLFKSENLKVAIQ